MQRNKRAARATPNFKQENIMEDIVLLSDGYYIYPVTTQEELEDGLNIGFHFANG